MAARVARQDDNKPGFSPDDGARGGADQDRDTTAAATASTDCQAPDRESTNGMAIKLFSHHRFRYGLLIITMSDASSGLAYLAQKPCFIGPNRVSKAGNDACSYAKGEVPQVLGEVRP
jgi:hypothetical protein